MFASGPFRHDVVALCAFLAGFAVDVVSGKLSSQERLNNQAIGFTHLAVSELVRQMWSAQR
jgi:hypothetical protein